MKKIDYETYCLLVQHLDKKADRNVEEFYSATTACKTDIGLLSGNNLIDIELLRNIEFSNMDFSLGLNFDFIELPSRKDKVTRYRSCRSFSTQKPSFENILCCLSETLRSDIDLRREYSSAGGLYPVEIFMSLNTDKFSNIPHNIKSGFYYIDNNNGKMILISERENHELNYYMMRNGSYFENAAFQIISIINKPKSIVKYNERGFRNAIIEVGAINHLLKNAFSELNIFSCESAEFDDYLLAQGIRLNLDIFKPILIQHFGYKK